MESSYGTIFFAVLYLFVEQDYMFFDASAFEHHEIINKVPNDTSVVSS